LEKKSELLEIHNHKTIGEWIVVVPTEIKETGVTSRSSQFEDRPGVGLVVSVGDTVDNMKEGDVIFFGKYSHVKITHNEIEYLIMRSEDVYCVA